MGCVIIINVFTSLIFTMNAKLNFISFTAIGHCPAEVYVRFWVTYQILLVKLLGMLSDKHIQFLV